MTYQFIPPSAGSNNRFAARLRLLRSIAGLSSADLAQAACMELSVYEAYESGRTVLTAAAAARLAPALGVGEMLFFEPI